MSINCINCGTPLDEATAKHDATCARIDALLALCEDAAVARAAVPPEGAENPAWGPMQDHYLACSQRIHEAIATWPEEDRDILRELYDPLRSWAY